VIIAPQISSKSHLNIHHVLYRLSHRYNENEISTFRLETLNPTSDSVIPIRLNKVTIEDKSSASAYNIKRSMVKKYI